MTVTAHPKDSAGAVLQAAITGLQANVVTSTPAKTQVDANLLQARKDLVRHFMDVGRIDPATILSTLS